MKSFVLLAASLAGICLASASSWAEPNPRSPNICVVPVENGRPTAADVHAVFRMVANGAVIPKLGQLYFAPYNRGGRWTVDRDGVYRPYRDVFPTGLTNLARHIAVDGAGRVIGGNATDIYVINPPGDRFRHLLSLKVHQAGNLLKLAYEPSTKSVFVSTRSGLFELRGDALVPSPYEAEAKAHGLARLYLPHYLPKLDALLFPGASRQIVLRRKDGAWQEIYRQRCGHNCEYITNVDSVVREDLVVVRLSKEIFAIDVSDPEDPQVSIVYKQGGRIVPSSARYSSTTDAWLIYDEKIFTHLTGNVAYPLVDAGSSWFLRLTHRGVEPVPGHKVVPTAYDVGKRRFYRTWFRDLPGRGQVLLYDRQGLALFDGERVQLLPDSHGDLLGWTPTPYVLASLDRTLVMTRSGLYELTKENRLEKLDTPFDATGFPKAEIVDAPHLGLAILFTKEGVYSLDRAGSFEPVIGGKAVALGFLNQGLAVIPGTDDILLQGQNALHILRTSSCEDQSGSVE